MTDKLDRVRKIIVEKTYQQQERHIDELEQTVDEIFQSIKKEIEIVRNCCRSDIERVKLALKDELSERDRLQRQFLLVKKDLENSKKTTNRLLLEASEKNRLFTTQQTKILASMKATITQEVSKVNNKILLENKSLALKLTQAYKIEIKSTVDPIDRKLAHIQKMRDSTLEAGLAEQKKGLVELQVLHTEKIDSLQSEVEGLKSMIGEILNHKK